MKILLTGKNGQVGWELQRTLSVLGEVIALDRHDMDLASSDSIRHTIRAIKPALIVNAAAYTEVEKAESEPDLAMVINGAAPGILAQEAERLGAVMVHYSTDYVFDGNKQGPYVEDDVPNPLNVYGKTKLEGERAIQAVGIPHLILRTSWVYGARGKNFLLTILRLAREQEELKIVDDQIGAPTWSRMVAEATAQILVQLYSPIAHYHSHFAQYGGIYHLTAGGQTSWYSFAKVIMENFSSLNHAVSASAAAFKVTNIMPITTDQYPSLVKRPRNSLLANTKLAKSFGLTHSSWDKQLNLCVQELVP